MHLTAFLMRALLRHFNQTTKVGDTKFSLSLVAAFESWGFAPAILTAKFT